MNGSVTHGPMPFPASCSGAPLVVFASLLIETINNALESEYQRCKSESSSYDSEEYFDFIVVGGGTAGCILASRLSETTASVLLLERGGTEPQQASVPAFQPFVWRTNTVEYPQSIPEPQNCKGAGCRMTVPFVLGGGSTLNGMMYARGSPEDYNNWADAVGDMAWNFTNVLHYFKKSERNLNTPIALDTEYHSSSGPQRISWQAYRHPAMRRLALAMKHEGVPFRLDVNARAQLGYTVLQTTTGGGERYSTYRSYLEPALRRPNLHVRTYASAKKIQVEAGRATGVHYMDAEGKIRLARARKEVILTAGSLYTPYLLMLSGIGPADHLKEANIPIVADLPVGVALQDHARATGAEYTCKPPLCKVDWDGSRADIEVYAKKRRGPLAANGVAPFTAFFKSSKSVQLDEQQNQRPDLQLLFSGSATGTGDRCMDGSWRFNRISVVAVALHPRSRGSVRLNVTSPTSPPVVRLGYFQDANDVDVVIEGVEKARRLAAHLRPLGLELVEQECGDFPPDSDGFAKCLVQSTSGATYHWVGTCPMGKDAAAVVDTRLRVRGVRGLRVADASVMPSLPSGNPMAAVIMVAEYAADLIKQDHGEPTGEDSQVGLREGTGDDKS